MMIGEAEKHSGNKGKTHKKGEEKLEERKHTLWVVQIRTGDIFQLTTNQ